MADQVFNVSSGFYNSVNSDRTYNAEHFNKLYERLISNGIFATPQGTPSTDLQVVSAESGMGIKVKKGKGIFSNRWFESSSDVAITVPSNTALLPRRDSVIVQVDLRQSGRVASIVYRTGTPASSPQPPAIGTVTDVVEYRIANVYVASSATYIGNDAIVDLRGSSECPWVTSLIQQVDTSTLYTQWNAAYQNYYNTETARFNAFMEQLTEELSVTTTVALLESHYTTVSSTATIPINITGFDKSTDGLIVFVNGQKIYGYTINSASTSITLSSSLTAGQNVDFLVLKSIVDIEDADALALLTQLSNSVSALTTDGGWINFTLEGGATAYTDSVKPAVRKYGNRVNLRGAFKGVTATGTTICTLPSAYKPAMDHVFTTSAVANGTISSTVTMQVLASTGQVKLLAKSGTIAATDMISIATNFIVG